ncbi:MAG: fructosamine kinase family protein [Thermoplasmata archaeon]
MVELNDYLSRIEAILKTGIDKYETLEGGMIGEVFKLELQDERTMVLKTGDTPMKIEAAMLGHLKNESKLPVPEVYYSTENFILMEFIEGETLNDHDIESEAAEYLAKLHSIKEYGFGFDYDTLTGPIIQPNDYMGSWIEFFKNNRLLYMNKKALDSNSISRSLYERIIELSDRLSLILNEPESPSLIHGDVWKINIIVIGDQIQAFLDPAIYYAHPEIELSYISFAETFCDEFYKQYDERSGIEDGFFEERCKIYQLYPLLVHAHLFDDDDPYMIDKKLQEIEF